MKKFIKNIIAFSAILTSINMIPIYAEENESESYVFKFSEFEFVTPEISKENSYVKHSKSDSSETYLVYDAETGLITDELTVSYPEDEIMTLGINPDARDAIFTRKKNVYGSGKLVVQLRLDICVKLYSSVSFRDFEAVNYATVNINSNATPMQLSGTPATSVTSHTGSFPCTQLDYSYTATVRTSGDITISGGYLISAGFTQSYHYYKTISDSGIIKLYN